MMTELSAVRAPGAGATGALSLFHRFSIVTFPRVKGSSYRNSLTALMAAEPQAHVPVQISLRATASRRRDAKALEWTALCGCQYASGYSAMFVIVVAASGVSA